MTSSNRAYREQSVLSSDWAQPIQDLPALPLVAQELSELIRHPATTRAQVADLMKQDQVLTAKLLKLANSSFYSIPGGVEDVSKALTFLGFNTVYQLVLSLSVMSYFSIEDEMTPFSLLEFWKHALATAIGAQFLAEQNQKLVPEEVFTGGLLHDLGKLVHLKLSPQTFQKTIELAKKHSESFDWAETQLQLPSHCDLGSLMAKRWNLPPTTVKAIQDHHSATIPIDSASYCVREANIASHDLGIGNSGNFKSTNKDQKKNQRLYSEIENKFSQMGGFLNELSS